MQYHEYVHIGRFDFEAGGSLNDIHIGYHTSPRPYTPGEKVILICHALTADSDPENWWPGLVGPGKLLDTEKYFIFCVNMLGSCYGSDGPSSINPETGSPYFFDFPRITVRDIAKAISIIRRHIGIEKVNLLIGSSIGGFQALELAISEPDVYENAIFMATEARVSPWLTALEETQRMALEADPTFRRAADLDGGKNALRCARTVALLSYRCPEGYNERQSEPDPDTLFASRASSYHQYQGEKFVRRFDAYSYYYLSYALDSHNVGRGRGGVQKALGTITARSTVIAIDSDILFPPYALKTIADGIPGAELHQITSLFGHDGFLLENDQLAAIFTPVLEKI